jgi:uncharacterized protein YecT (DUF1311 family)
MREQYCERVGSTRAYLRILHGLFVLGMVWVGHAPAYGASFDCAKAKAPIEFLICDSEAISNFDTELALEFSRIRNQLSGQAARDFIEEQRKWLARRLTECGIPAQGDRPDRKSSSLYVCVGEMYAKRISALELQKVEDGRRIETGSSEDSTLRYPPYPDVWGIDLPMATAVFGNCINPSAQPYNLPNGDLKFLVYFWEGATTSDCSRGAHVRNFLVDFFEQSIVEISQRRAVRFEWEHRAFRLRPDVQKIDLKFDFDVTVRGSIISGTDNACFYNIRSRLAAVDAIGIVTRTIYNVQILDTAKENPLSQFDEDADEGCGSGQPPGNYFSSRVLNSYFFIAKLRDETLVAWSWDAPAIFRFGPDLQPQFRSKQGIFWLGEDIIAELEARGIRNNVVSEHDALLTHLESLRGKR